MLVTVYFSKIRHEIISHIRKANNEIRLAVAWLTDEDILRELTHRSKAGVSVKIAISDSMENFINIRPFKEFINAGGHLFINTKNFLHHKFCLFDDHIIINGSYNWSYAARSNEENVTVMTREKSDREENLVFDGFRAKHTFLCERCSVAIFEYATLKAFQQNGKNVALILSVTDETEIKLREQFQDRIKQSFDTAQALNIRVGDGMIERMENDGGGVEFVKRILHDEMTSGDMKPGFKQLESQMPHKVNLSLEYLVIQPEFNSLFTEQEVAFCKKLMTKYKLV